MASRWCVLHDRREADSCDCIGSFTSLLPVEVRFSTVRNRRTLTEGLDHGVDGVLLMEMVRGRWFVATILLAAAGTAAAVEGGVGRSFVGAQITPYVGVVPPEPGFIFSFDYIYLDGKIGAGKQTPIAGNIALDLDATFDLYAASIVYVWDTGPGRWNFASVVDVPFDQVKASAELTLGPASARASDKDSGLFDMLFVPVLASYHASPVDHWSFGLYISAPTGSYNAGQLANNSLNYWTFAPAVGYTHLFDEGTLEFSTLAGLDINTTNSATHYHSGTMFRVDAALTKHLPNGWALGLVGGALEQISDDTGSALADQLNGFRGHSYGLGPSISYTHAFSKTSNLSFAFRYVFNFDAAKQLKGDPLLFSVTFTP
jgi:hypothetical protein